MKFQLSVVLATLVLGLGGCGNNNSPVAPVQVDSTAPPPANDIGLELLSIKDVPTQLAARKGKVVVLDMWATW